MIILPLEINTIIYAQYSFSRIVNPPTIVKLEYIWSATVAVSLLSIFIFLCLLFDYSIIICIFYKKHVVIATSLSTSHLLFLVSFLSFSHISFSLLHIQFYK